MGKIGGKLKGIREKYGMNQAEFAKRLGFSRSYIAMVETEKTQIGGFIPSLDFIRSLAKNFSLSRDELEKLRDLDKESYMKNKERIPIHLVPVLNSISAEKLLEWEGEYPGIWAEEWIEGDRDVADSHAFALRVMGDSGEPEFKEGEYVVVAPALQWENGDYVVVADAKGEEALLKKIMVEGENIVLVSENPKYENIILKKGVDPRVIGKVIRKIKKY